MGCLKVAGGLLLAVALTACSDDESAQGDGAALGDVGESCTARRDCAAPLACVEQVCVDPTATDGGVAAKRGGPERAAARATIATPIWRVSATSVCRQASG